ncbi:MAG: CDP-archaeol synthase [Anaerolineae bacterium]|nr:CDP-archaeol synthase [Anaerolineae bacterium]
MALKRAIKSPLFIRAIGTLLYGVIFLWLVFTGGLALFIGVLIVTAIAAYEFYQLMARGDHRPLTVVGIATALLFVCSVYFTTRMPFPGRILIPGLVLAVLVSIVWMVVEHFRERADLGGSGRNYLRDWLLTFAGAIYTGGLLSHVLLLRSLERGDALLAIVVFGTAACDSGAYLIGSRLGRTKFAPVISPKKTWEGTIGGFLTSVAVVVLASWLFDLPVLPAVGMGILVAIAVISGDLVESIIKRSVGAKDSGAWIPEQGGILDVIDGFMFAVVVSYYYLLLVS